MQKYSLPEVCSSSEKLNSPSQIYCCDYLNLWSDYREIKYKKKNVNFHDIKHLNKEQDTYEFFDIFFTKYITYVNSLRGPNKIDINGNFIFVMKKIYNYDNILYNIIEMYSHLNIRFIIIESKYNNTILDKNKDDFLCQYIFSYLLSNNDNCKMISNDKYRDSHLYIKKFKTILIKVIKKKNNDLIENAVMEMDIDNTILIKDVSSKRTSIPKNQLKNIL